MLRPTAEALERLDDFRATGVADLGWVHVEREGRAGTVELRNPRALNAEDDTTSARHRGRRSTWSCSTPRSRSACCAAALLDHPRYAGRRIFGAGINLTRLYHGKIPYLFFLVRDLGLRQQDLPRALDRRAPPRRARGHDREAVGRGGRHVRDRRRLPAPARGRPRDRRARRAPVPARAQGGDHPGRLPHAPAARRRRPLRAPGDPLRPGVRGRRAAGAAARRRGGRARGHGRGRRGAHRGADQLGARQRRRQPPRDPRSARSRSTCSGATWRPTRASRPSAT